MFAYGPTGNLEERLIRPASGQAVVVEDVMLIDGTGAAPRPATLVIRDRRIEKILRSEREVTDISALRIHGQGRVVTPGLIDCHVHLTGITGRGPFRYIERYPTVRTIRSVRDANAVLAGGFTTVRHLGHGDPLQAQALKCAISEGLVAGPRMLTSGWAISQTGGHGNLPDWPYALVEHLRPRSAFCDGPDECRKFVRRVLGDGADCIKIYTTEGIFSTPDHLVDIPNFSRAEVEAITDEAHRMGAHVAAHATGLDGSKEAVRAGVDTLEHGPAAPDGDLLEVAKQNGTVLVPTLSSLERVARGEEDWLPRFAVERAQRSLEGKREMVRAAAAAGIPIGVGTDSGGPPRAGRNVVEIIALSAAGLGPLRAIQAATADGAVALGLESEIGTVTEGKFADLVLWEKDPLDDISVMLEPDAIRLVVQSSVGEAQR